MKKVLRPADIYKTTGKTFKTIRKYGVKYHNLILLTISIVLAFYILKTDIVASFIENLGNFGYVASFIAGMFFTYGITTVPAAAAFFELGQVANPLLLALIGATGAVISDYIIFRIVRDNLLGEIKLLSAEVSRLTEPVSQLFFWEELRIRIWRTVSKSRIWHAIIPAVAGFIIASPLPDEIGVALFGAIKFDPRKFVIAAYLLNFVGILLVTYSGRMLF